MMLQQTKVCVLGPGLWCGDKTIDAGREVLAAFVRLFKLALHGVKVVDPDWVDQAPSLSRPPIRKYGKKNPRPNMRKRQTAIIDESSEELEEDPQKETKELNQESRMMIANKSVSDPKGIPSPDIKWSMKGVKQAVFSRSKPGGTAI